MREKMRTEKEMFDLILNTAREDERIRAVYMNGSRTNKNVPRDIFQDYDIVYVVQETQSFYQDLTWIDRFGKRLYMQKPEEMDLSVGQECNLDECYGWLIQFVDGNRMDLHVVSIPFAEKTIPDDKLCKVLLDKDRILPEVPEPSDEDYRVKRPTEAEFRFACNEFWWCLNNVAKGMWRAEIPYVMESLNSNVRPQLTQMLTWMIGIEHDFSCSVGKAGKYLEKFLSPQVWNQYVKTYSTAELEAMWESIFSMCGLFDETAKKVGEKLGFSYNQEEADASRGFLEHVRNLPADALGIF